jgi:hypothetical protein
MCSGVGGVYRPEHASKADGEPERSESSASRLCWGQICGQRLHGWDDQGESDAVDGAEGESSCYRVCEGEKRGECGPKETANGNDPAAGHEVGRDAREGRGERLHKGAGESDVAELRGSGSERRSNTGI